MAQVFDVLARLNFDKGNTDAVISSVNDQLTKIAKGSSITLDTSGSAAGIGQLNAQVATQVQSINDWKKSLTELKTVRDSAEDTTKLNALNTQIATATEQIKAMQAPVKQAFDITPVQNLDDELSKVPANIEKISNSASSLGSEFKKGLSFASAIVGVQGIESTLLGSIDAYKQNEQAAQGLGIALGDLPNGGKQAISTLTDWAKTQRDTTEFTTASIEKTITLGEQLGGLKDAAHLEEFTARMEDFAAATGQSLEDVSQTIATKIQAGGTDRQLHIDFNPGDTEGNIDKFLAATENKFGGFAQKIADSPQAGLILFQKDLQEAEGSIGGALVSAIDPILPLVEEFATGAEKLTEVLVENKTAVETAAIAWGVLRVNLAVEEAGGMGKELEDLTTEATKLGKEILEHLVPGLFAKKAAETAGVAATEGATAAQEGLNAAEEANPIGLIIAAIFVLVEVFIQLYEHSEVVRDIMDQVWEKLKIVGDFIKNYVVETVGALVKGFEGLGEALIGVATGDFGKVVEGAGKVGDAIKQGVNAPMTAGIKTADDFTEHVLTGVEKQIADWQKADQAFLNYSKNLEGKQQTAAQLSSDNIKGIQASIQSDLQQIANDLGKPALTMQQFNAEAAKGFQDWSGSVLAMAKGIQSNKDILAQWEQEVSKTSLATKTLNDLTGQNAEGNLSKLQEEAKRQADILQIKLQQTANDEHRTLTANDNLLVAEKTYSVFQGQAGSIQSQINAFKSIDPTKAEELQKSFNQIQSTLKNTVTDLKYKVTVDTLKAQDDLTQLLLDNQQKTLDLAIHPKMEDVDGILSQIKLFQDQLGRIHLNLSDPIAEKEAEGQSETLKGKIIADQKQINDIVQANIQDRFTSQIGLLNSQADLEITAEQNTNKLKLATIKDAEAKEIEAARLTALQKLQVEIQAQAAGKGLTEEQSQQAQQVTNEEQKSILDIKKKYDDLAQKQELSIFAVTKEGLLAVWGDFTKQKQVLDTADANDKRLGFDKQQQDLERNLAKGSISQAEFNVKMAKLAQDRLTFESAQDDTLNTRLKAGFDTVAAKAKSSLDTQLEDFLAAKSAQLISAQITSIEIAVAEASGNAAAIASIKEKQIAQDSANSTTLAGLAYNVAAGWSSIPFVGAALGIAAAIAATLAVNSLVASAIAGKPTIGFAQGGLGIVGEKGVGEVFGPVSDFSQFSSQLATQTAVATERALNNRPPSSTGQNGSIGVRLSGETRLSGRTLVTGIQRETASQNNERLIPA